MIGTQENKHLTNTTWAANLFPLVQHVPVWFGSHKKHKMPIARLIRRLRFHMQKSSMVDVIWGASARMVLVPCLPTWITFTAISLVALSGVLKHTQEVNTMSQNNSVQLNTQAQSEQDQTSEFLLNQLQKNKAELHA